ncbi:hypothetical protein E1091_04810 [Micromonospora fluostatini]|uniref:Uncharacterized protein n=1 Tax=Micromonospora fluostatini TaxID=1629071 RepID=A0ABY2DJN9_9ACTN|nr:hypothetical protein E1091_04810 [Micromonospora fluostatini]
MTAAGRWPRVSRCRWCARPVLRDNDGAWIHADLAYVCRDGGGGLSYVCRDSGGGLAATTAEPEVVRYAS